MHISQLSINRPVSTTMFFVAVCLIGIISLFQLSVDLLPDLSYPKLTIWTTMEDMGPREIEELITRPIEESIGTVEGIRSTNSVSKNGLSLVTIEFLWGTHMDFATLSIREKLDQLRWTLPREAERPNILRIDPRNQPIMAISLSGSNLVHLKELARNVFKRRLEQIKGVAMATVTGGLEREIQVDVDQRALHALHLSSNQVTNALKLANYSITGGTIKRGLYRYSLRTISEFQDVAEIENVVIQHRDDGSQIRIRDIARVVDGFRDRQSITRFNNNESIGVIVRKEAGANTVAVSKLIDEVLDQLRRENPNIQITVAYNSARFISSSISSVMQNLYLGALLSFLVLFVFLHDFRNPFNISLSIPISVLATFGLLYFSGISLNIMSIGGLALGVGMLVDNAIIVLENIFRHRQEGKPMMEAAYLGAKEVALAISASTFTTIAIFLPVVYIYGVAGQLFHDQAITVAFSLIASLVVALTLLPMMSCRFQPDSFLRTMERQPTTAGSPRKISSRPWKWLVNPILWLAFYSGFGASQLLRALSDFFRSSLQKISSRIHKRMQPIFNWFDRQYESAEVGYHWLLQLSLNYRGRFIVIVVILFVLGLVSIRFMNRQLMPLVDQGEFSVNMELPVGSTLEATEAAASTIEKWLTSQPDVAAVFSAIGLSEDQAAQFSEDAGINHAKLQIQLKKKRARSTGDLVTALRSHAAGLTAGTLTFDSGEHIFQQILGTATPPIVIKFRGSELSACRDMADSIAQRLAGIAGLKDLHSDYIEGQPEYRIEIDREKASRYGFTVATIAEFIKYQLAGLQATEFKDFDRKISVMVRPQLSQRDDLADLLSLAITENNLTIPLRELVTVTPSLGPSEIRHEDQNRQVCLLANISNRSLSDVVSDITRTLDPIQIPPDYQIVIGGEQEEVHRSFRSLVFALVIAILLIYMIMAAQFESLRHPFIILLDVPLTIAFLSIVLWLSGIGLNVISFIGLIVLAGIAVNDSIVKVDFINQHRRQGATVLEAIDEASKKRFRPIIMTFITTVLGLFPMALGFGEGAELQQPLAITLIIGLSISTVISLIAVPVFYTYFGDKDI
ncbi:MAG: efflux RND transporter permease subunit [Candidatus Zhuqueibacterota bacterium]